MASHRGPRMAEAIREVVSTAILFDVADPRVRAVTVLAVEMSNDLRQATVKISIMGNEAERKRVFQGIEHASGFLQARVAARLQTRFTPVLAFKIDQGVKKSVDISRLIEEAVASDRREPSPEDAPEGGASESQDLPTVPIPGESEPSPTKRAP